MEAIRIFYDEKSNHRIMQIDLNEIDGSEESLEDIMDRISIELRKDEESIPWEEVKKQLPAM